MSIYEALVGGAIGIAGGIYQNRQNRKEAALAFQRQRQLINEANIYNAPVNQMARLREAGLNPNLIYGNGTGSMISASAGTPPAAHQENVMQNLGIYTSMKQLDMQKRQLDLQERDIKLREAQNPSIIKKNEAEADKTNSEIDVNTQSMLNMMQDREHRNQLLELNKSALALSNAMQDFSLEERKRLSPLIELNQMLQNEQIMSNIRLDKIRVGIQQSLANSSIEVNDAQIKKIGADTNMNKFELKFFKSVANYRYYQERLQGLSAKSKANVVGREFIDQMNEYINFLSPLVTATVKGLTPY